MSAVWDGVDSWIGVWNLERSLGFGYKIGSHRHRDGIENKRTK